MQNDWHKNSQILFIASYPPRACGIATYSKDLVDALKEKFDASFSIKVCAVEEKNYGSSHQYPDEVIETLQANDLAAYERLAQNINLDDSIKMVVVQHEFGLFGGDYGEYLLQLLYALEKPLSITFHTILPRPAEKRKRIVSAISRACDQIVVMTNDSATILAKDYEISRSKITIIPHGTHLIPWGNKVEAKQCLGFENRLVLSTFGLLSSNKSIETALEAMPDIVDRFPNVLYNVLGRTHPSVVEYEGEEYRNFLVNKVQQLGLEKHVNFVNRYLDLPELLAYLHLTDIYLFTSKDPYQAVSGTFAYAMSSACAVISTRIPHAREMLKNNAGILIDFQNPGQLSKAALHLLDNKSIREEMGSTALHYARATCWQNIANSHAILFHKHIGDGNKLIYNAPDVSLDHVRALTTRMGIVQFAKISVPDMESGYTLDDNARALIAICLHRCLQNNGDTIDLIDTYLNFIERCQQPNGRFLNYVNEHGEFHIQNDLSNLEDSNGRAIWALGVVMNHKEALPSSTVNKAFSILQKTIPTLIQIQSPRALAFSIKGLYLYYEKSQKPQLKVLIDMMAARLLEKYNDISDTSWPWFEEYLTYANSTLPEALLLAHMATGKTSYKMIAHLTFEFLLSHLFMGNHQIKVISNRGWHHKGCVPDQYGEQPIDVSYTIQALELFYRVFKDPRYLKQIEVAFSWFHGNNHLHQIIYNPMTGGCYDGLEQYNVNLNQGAESTVCYLIARLTIEKLFHSAHLKPLLRRVGTSKTLTAPDVTEQDKSTRKVFRRVSV